MGAAAVADFLPVGFPTCADRGNRALTDQPSWPCHACAQSPRCILETGAFANRILDVPIAASVNAYFHNLFHLSTTNFTNR